MYTCICISIVFTRHLTVNVLHFAMENAKYRTRCINSTTTTVLLLEILFFLEGLENCKICMYMNRVLVLEKKVQGTKHSGDENIF